jgi:hypothetical protein
MKMMSVKNFATAFGRVAELRLNLIEARVML